MALNPSLARVLPWLAVGIATALPSLALAAGSSNVEVLGRTCGFLTQIRGWFFGIAYVLGAIGLVIIAVSAFLGRFKFAHLIALGGGLFIVAMADIIIRFATSGASGGMSCTAEGGGA